MRVRSCGLPTKRARARRSSSAGGAEESEGDVYGIASPLRKANRRMIGNPPCHVNGHVAVCLGPGSAGFQPAAASETPALPRHWRYRDAADIERSVVLQILLHRVRPAAPLLVVLKRIRPCADRLQ